MESLTLEAPAELTWFLSCPRAAAQDSTAYLLRYATRWCDFSSLAWFVLVLAIFTTTSGTINMPGACRPGIHAGSDCESSFSPCLYRISFRWLRSSFNLIMVSKGNLYGTTPSAGNSARAQFSSCLLAREDGTRWFSTALSEVLTVRFRGTL